MLKILAFWESFLGSIKILLIRQEYYKADPLEKTKIIIIIIIMSLIQFILLSKKRTSFNTLKQHIIYFKAKLYPFL